MSKVSRPLLGAEETLRQKESSPAGSVSVTLSVLLLSGPIAPDCAAKLPDSTTLFCTVQAAGEAPDEDNCQGRALKLPLSKPSKTGGLTGTGAANTKAAP